MDITISTREEIPKGCVELGVVRGSCVYSANVVKDVQASIKNVTGGEMKYYTRLVNNSIDIALERMVEHAKELGATGICALTFFSPSVSLAAAEVGVVGTAYKRT